jgi:glycosyltransferase involved in cell wall biosynthesis
MKILFVGAYVPYPLNSGGRIRSYHLLRELAAQHEVHLLTLSHEPEFQRPSALAEGRQSPPETLRKMCRTIRTVPATARPEGTAHRLRRLLHNPSDILIGRSSPDMEAELCTALGREPFDLVFLDEMGTERYLGLLAGQRMVLSKHNCEWRLLRQQTRYKASRPWAWALSWLETEAVRRPENAVASQVHRVLVASQADRAALQKAAPYVRIDVIPNGVNVAEYTPTSSQGHHRLLFIGAMFWYPNVDAMRWFCRTIWPRVQRAKPAACFDWVGCGPAARIPPLDSTRSVQVIPDAPDVRPYLARAAAFVVPLRIGAGTRLKILEAMAAGRAVVSTSVGAEGLELQPGQEFLLADSPTDFAAACTQLLGDHARRDRLGLMGRRAVESRYDWSIVLADLNRICVEVSEGQACR